MCSSLSAVFHCSKLLILESEFFLEHQYQRDEPTKKRKMKPVGLQGSAQSVSHRESCELTCKSFGQPNYLPPPYKCYFSQLQSQYGLLTNMACLAISLTSTLFSLHGTKVSLCLAYLSGLGILDCTPHILAQLNLSLTKGQGSMFHYIMVLFHLFYY